MQANHYYLAAVTISILSLVMQIIGLSAIIISAKQFLAMKKQKQDGHEEERRKKTIEVMQIWSSNLQRETSLAEKIVEEFDENQARRLYAKQDVEVSREIKCSVCEICRCEPCPGQAECEQLKEGPYILKGYQQSKLRWHVIRYLNNLENVFTAYALGIVDRDVIKTQFSYLYNPGKGWDAIEKIRKAAGANGYPNTNAFMNELVAESEQGKSKNSEPLS